MSAPTCETPTSRPIPAGAVYCSRCGAAHDPAVAPFKLADYGCATCKPDYSWPDVVARVKLHPSRDPIEAEAINPGEWWGRVYLIEVGCGCSSFYYAVEADNDSDAIDEFADSTAGHLIDADSDMSDSERDDWESFAGNDGHAVDLDNVMIHGPFGGARVREQGDGAAGLRYYGPELPAKGVRPERYGAWREWFDSRPATP